METLKIEVIEYNLSHNIDKKTSFVIREKTLDKCFAIFFRDYSNRYKYCNNINYRIVSNKKSFLYKKWISDISNYLNNGGDPW